MSDFFHGWRRKTGSVLLVMVFAIAVTWARSLLVIDEITLPRHGVRHSIASAAGRVLWSKSVPFFLNDRRYVSNEWKSGPTGWKSLTLPAQKSPNIHDPWENQWRLAFGGFECRKDVLRVGLQTLRFRWYVPYWSIVFPLTLLSAYLILWKPRKSPAA